MIAKNKTLKTPLLIIAVTLATAGLLLLVRTQKAIPEDNFLAPGRSWESSKKVEDYFVDKLRMTPEDLERNKDRTTVDFRLSKESALDGIIGNLAYYGFIKDEKAFRQALEQTQDTAPGREPMIRVGKSGYIDLESSYRISEDKTAWELADTLLNKPTHFRGDTYPGYLFMP